MTVEATADKETKKESLKNRAADMDAREAKLNEGKSGVGVRSFIAMTRGKNPVEIQYEAFDDSKPETLPTSIQQFMDVTNVKDEPSLVGYLIGGYNDSAYTSASDPLKEFVDLTWPDDAQTQFRLVVRNYSRGANVSLEDAVSLIKPGFAKQFEKK